MKLSIIIPVYNEYKTVEELVGKVKKVNIGSIEKEIIIVDDGSKDQTIEILKSRIEPIVSKVIYNEKNGGKGSAVRTGLKNVSGDLVIIQDADLEYDPEDYNILLKPILENKADVVYGSRFMGDSAHRVNKYWHFIGNRIVTTLSNIFTNLNLIDEATCYKLFRKEVLDKITLTENGFGIDIELTAKVSHQKIRMYEVGISYYGRSYEEGKKIGWKDGFRTLYVILKYGIFKRR
jgi:glycosyltransferase involved in cell wall biosynthesis